jgi:hypothetical protein
VDRKSLLHHKGFWLLGDYGSSGWMTIIFLSIPRSNPKGIAMNTAPETGRPHRTPRVHFASVLGAGALAVGAMLATATQANAQPIAENDIKTECKAAGGTYTTKPPARKGGTRISTCAGSWGKDTYFDGYWVGTDEPQ